MASEWDLACAVGQIKVLKKMSLDATLLHLTSKDLPSLWSSTHH